MTEAVVVEGFPNTGLDEAAIGAVRKTSWYPAKQGGNSVGLWVEIPVVFLILYETFPVPIGGYETIQKNIIYPEIAQEGGLEGMVVVQAFVDEKGRVIKTLVQRGIPSSGLDEAAMDAIRKTKFKPAKKKGVAVGVWIVIPVNFRLSG